MVTGSSPVIYPIKKNLTRSVWPQITNYQKNKFLRLWRKIAWHIKIAKKVTHEKQKKPNYLISVDALFRYLSDLGVDLNLQMKKPNFAQVKSSVFYLYYRMVVRKHYNSITFLKPSTSNDRHQVILINNTRKQLLISFVKGGNFFMSFTTGYCLTYLKLFQKKLKHAISSFSLQLKFIMGVIEKCYIHNFFILNIKGTKKTFFKWLNVLKLKTERFKLIYYIHTPHLSLSKINLKKIKAIKKRMRKKYLYQEDMV